jgi:hypothetical protein
MSFKNLEGQPTCWIQRLQEYNSILEHHQDWKHNKANALSQQPCQENCSHCHKVKEHVEFKLLQL